MQTSQNPLTPEILQQNPFLAVYLLFFTFVLLTALVGFVSTWIFILWRGSQGKPLLPLTLPWQPSRWSLLEVLGIAFGGLLFNSLLALGAAKALNIQRPEGGIPLELAAAGSLGSIITVLLATAWICLRFRVSPEHVGFIKPRWQTLAVGVFGGLAVLPMMYALMGVVSNLFETEYEHPLIDSAIDSATLTTYLLAFFSAALAAPIAEEFFFRVILQGWLQSIPFKSLFSSLAGERTVESSMETADSRSTTFDDSASASGYGSSVPSVNMAAEIKSSEVQQATSPSTTLSMAGDLASVYSPSQSSSYTASNHQGVPANISPPFWPAIISGVLFGLAHFDYGVSFIPLSFLGIFLGWIYRQTHAIWPCIIIHMMLNTFSMLGLALVILMKQAGITLQ